MNRVTFRIRIAGLAGTVILLVLLVTRPVGALPFLVQATEEPTPRPTPTPAPYVELNPTQGVAGDATTVTATGALWLAGGTVTLYWDNTSLALASTTVNADGSFATSFVTPTDPAVAAAGVHTVIAVQGASQAEAAFELIGPTDTPTPTVTNTPEPPTKTFTPTPKTPTPTPSTTPTVIPTATFRPVTPMVTISPMPPPATQRPATRVPVATRTNTPVPGPPTITPLPTITPFPSPTPGPGTPSATPLPTAQPTPTPVEEISDTGAGVGTIFLWGFVLGGLLLVFRLLRVRGLAG